MADVLSVINPATEALIQEVPIDDEAAVAQKFKQAQQAQPLWAALPLADRISPILRFMNIVECMRIKTEHLVSVFASRMTSALLDL